MGITLAILSCVGTMPLSKESRKMWCKALAMLKIIFLRKLVEIPLWLGVFLSCNSLVASRISEMVTGVFLRLNSELLFGIFSVGDKLDGLILLTTSTAAVTKNLLKLSAISKGSLILLPLTIRDVQLSFLFLVLRMAL